MLTVPALLALAASTTLFQGAQAQDLITSDDYFYGESEPVYPSPEITGLGSWAESYAKAQAFVAQLTLEEKASLTGGTTNSSNGCGGKIASIPRVGFPGLCLQDAAGGVRGTDLVNAYSSGIHAGASWNKNLTYDRAYHIGGEFRRKGVNIALGPPVVGPIGRIAEGGRNWEGFSNDPYHAGILAGLSVHGVQDQGVISCTKHFLGNEQETARNPLKNAQNITVQSSSSNLDDVTLHEMYLWPFYDAIHAGSASVMCSYNRLNNSYACQNSKALNGILKGELGYQGFVVSDWGAQHSGVGSALAGLDMAMPSGLTFWGGNLTQAVNNGSVTEARINDMATRVIASWYHLGQDSSDYPSQGVGLPATLSTPHERVDARVPEARPVLMQSAIEGHVLVKNINNALPLRSPKVLSLFGYDAVAPTFNTPTTAGLTDWAIGLQSSWNGYYICGFYGTTDCPPPVAIAPNGTLWTGGGSGASQPSYISAPFDAIQNRAMEDNTQLYWDFRNINATAYVYGASDAALVFINAMASEGADRPALRDDFSDALVTNIAAQNNNTIVVIHNAGVRLVDQWIDNPNVTAVIFAHLPGQDSGNALVKLLYGEVSPSGKLPYTVARNESDYGRVLKPIVDEGANGEFARYPQDDFSEGVFIDYRAFDASEIEPRFEFGFGLTYTTFDFSGLTAAPVDANAAPSQYPVGQVVPGGQSDLWDVVATVTASVTNTGSVAAQEVAQLYLGIPADGQPIRQLRGFEKVLIQPGETALVEFELKRRDLSVWDTAAQKWSLILDADYQVYVGSSSRDLPLTGTLRL
ncbi:cel3e secreted beta-glucosidase [Phlyctema vagabunda]|uniref:beta-glucosidase n=1 Tax=Phlyctema vagabunda TaxID=108571 RepID=A0ABR4PJF7_9HELO